MQCTTMKEVWDKLKSINEGDDKVKKEKLKTFSTQFETLTMKDEEDVATYLLRVDEIVKYIARLGDTIE